MAETPAGFATDPPPRGAKPATADWRGGANAGASKGKLVAVTMILLLAIGGVIAGLIFWPKTALEPRFVTIGIDQYGELWPVNPWADSDSARINAVFGDRGNMAFNYQQADKFRQWLDWIAAKPGSTASDLPAEFVKQPLIVHITALAVAKADGVSLLLPSAAGVEPLPLDTLLDAIKECPAPKKLLLLDIAHPVADGFNGNLLDNVATALDDALTRRKASGNLTFAVLTSCGPGQQSFPCDADRCSGFALYVAEGLKGAADGAVDVSKSDDQIMLTELARFTAARVDRWSQRVYGQRQVPMLYAPDDGDFVVSYKQKLSDDRYDPPAMTGYPPGLAQAWQDLAAASDRDTPVVRARWTADLLRAEQLAARSGHPDRAEEAWRSAKLAWEEDFRGLASGLSTADAIKATNALALRWHLPATPITDAKAPAELGKLLDAFLTAKPEEEAKAKPAWQAKAVENPADAARLIWQRALATERPERRDFRRWADALAALKLPRPSAEGLLLDRLARHDFVQDQGLARTPSEALASLLRAEAAIGRASVAAPFGSTRTVPKLRAADASRREAEQALFAAKTMADATAAGVALNAASVEIEGIVKAAEVRQATQARSGEALQLLLATAIPAVRHNSPDFAVWKQGAMALTSLMDKLAANGDGRDELQELARVLPRLQERCDPAVVAKLLKDGPPRTTAAEVTKLADRLSGPALASPIRGDLSNAVMTDRIALHKAVRQLDKADDEAKQPLVAPTADAPVAAVDIALRRAEASAMLLKVAGAAKLAAADTAMRSVAANSANAAAWDTLGAALRTEWLTGVPAQMREALAQQQWTQAERLTRVIPAELARYRERNVSTLRPWQELVRTDVAAHRLWVLKQLADDAPLRARGDAATKFYDEARTDNHP